MDLVRAEITKVYFAVAKACRNGILVKPDRCGRCQNRTTFLVAHHHKGYAQEHWLDVMWVCESCHWLEHQEHPELHRPTAVSKTVVYNLRLSRAVLKRFRDLAWLDGQRTAASMMRAAIDEYLVRKDAPPAETK